MAVSRVVKLEHILSRDGDKVDSMHALTGDSNSDLQLADNASDLENLEKELDAAEVDEARDKVYELPENWPNIPQLTKRRSCELTRATEPCVQKAVSHLELIQNIIEEWFRTKELAGQSGQTSRLMDSKELTPVPKKHLRFLEESRTGTSSTKRLTTADLISSRSTSASTTLSVQGEKLKGSEEKEAESGSLETGGVEVPFLGAEDVVDEVITLLARLEQDKMITEERLQGERERVGQLNKRMDELCRKRLRDLPALVQREHEACLVDLNELQWHISYETRTLSKIKEKTAVDEVVNKRLKEDLDFVKKHIPLLQEKLQLEVEAMEKIKKAQAETNTELQATQQRQAKTEQKSSEALNKAETERGHIKRELDNVRGNLNQISEELSEAKMTYNSYVHQMNDISQQLRDNAQEYKVLKVKSENARVAEEMQNTKVRDLQNRITDAEFEQRRLDNENFQLQQELKTMRATHDHELQTLETACRHLEAKLRAVLLKNQEMSMEIQDLEEKIANCERERTANEKNINRIYRDIDRTETLLKATLDEHQKVFAINQHIKEQLLMEQEKAFKTEESLKEAEIEEESVTESDIEDESDSEEQVESDSWESETDSSGSSETGSSGSSEEGSTSMSSEADDLKSGTAEKGIVHADMTQRQTEEKPADLDTEKERVSKQTVPALDPTAQMPSKREKLAVKPQPVMRKPVGSGRVERKAVPDQTEKKGVDTQLPKADEFESKITEEEHETKTDAESLTPVGSSHIESQAGSHETEEKEVDSHLPETDEFESKITVEKHPVDGSTAKDHAVAMSTAEKRVRSQKPAADALKSKIRKKKHVCSCKEKKLRKLQAKVSDPSTGETSEPSAPTLPVGSSGTEGHAAHHETEEEEVDSRLPETDEFESDIAKQKRKCLCKGKTLQKPDSELEAGQISEEATPILETATDTGSVTPVESSTGKSSTVPSAMSEKTSGPQMLEAADVMSDIAEKKSTCSSRDLKEKEQESAHLDLKTEVTSKPVYALKPVGISATESRDVPRTKTESSAGSGPSEIKDFQSDETKKKHVCACKKKKLQKVRSMPAYRKPAQKQALPVASSATRKPSFVKPKGVCPCNARRLRKNTVENLRRQVKEEVHARTVLQARINSDSSEIDKSRLESGKKRNKAQKVVEEVDGAVAVVQEKVERLRQAQTQKKQMKEDLARKIEETKIQHVESEERLKQQIVDLEPKHKILQEQLLAEQKKLDQINWKSNLMKKKMDDMAASESMMNKVMDSTLKAIASLQEEHDELQIQVEDAKKMEAQLRAMYNDVLERLRHNTSKHRQFMSDRETAYAKHEEEKERHFRQNKELASRYRQLQNEYVVLKEAVLRSYEERVKMESSINDVRQLQALQKKMHSAMVEYFKLSGMYNEAELEKLANESASNGQRVTSLQNEMDSALRNITDFLKQQMDISVNRVKATDALTPHPPPSAPTMIATK